MRVCGLPSAHHTWPHHPPPPPAHAAKSTPEVHTFLKGWKVTLEDGSEPESPEEPPFDIVDVEAALQVEGQWSYGKPPSLPHTYHLSNPSTSFAYTQHPKPPPARPLVLSHPAPPHASCPCAPNHPTPQVRNKDADLHFWTVAGAIWAVNKPPSLQDPLATQVCVHAGMRVCI